MHASAQLNAALTGRYRVEREIGAGGMATVYLARDLRHDRAVALKVLKPDLGAVMGVERFLSEIRVTAHLEHPNLLPLFDSGEADGLLFYVMPYVEGESLRALLARQTQLPIEDALHIAVRVASALDYAHRHGVIHRDLKPENILLQDGEPLVGDFGIALALNNASGNRLTKTGISLGTPTYMSPEQAAGDRHVDARSDVYSLGVVLYEMLTGEPPHVGATAQAVIAKVITDKPVSMRCRRDTIPEHVDAAVDRALSKVPADRFATAHEFADALAGRGVSIGAGVPGNVHIEKRTPLQRRSRQGALWGALTLASAGVLAIGWSVTRSGAPPPAAPVRLELTFGDSVSLATDVFGPVLALSPNGREIAFVGLAGGRHRIYVRALDELTAHPLDGSDDGRRPLFSPDGQWVAFEQGTPAALQKVPVSGGQSTTVASGGVITFDWDDDGSIVFARPTGGLWRVSSAGGEPILLAMPDTARGEGLSWPRTLPGVKTVLCNLFATAVGGSVVGNPEVVAIGPDGTMKKLGIAGTNPRYIATGHLLVTRSDGTVLAAPFDVENARVTGPSVPVLEHVIRKSGGAAEFSVSRNGTLAYVAGPSPRQVTLMDRAGRGTVLLSGTDRSLAHPRFSPDGKRLALQTGDVELGDVWMVDIGTRTKSRVTQDGHSGGAEWTADGRQLLFWSGSPTQAALVRTMWDGSGAAETLAVGLHAKEFAISPTSNTIILRTSNARGDLYVGSLDSIKTLHPWLATPAARAEDPRFSIDGKWIAYVSREAGRREVYVRSFTGSGGRLQVSTVGGHYPRWSGDGRTIFYSVNAYDAQAVGVGPHLIAATLRFNPEPAVIRRDTVFAGHNAANIWNAYGFDYDVAPDGAHFAIISSALTKSQAVVVLNWFTELRNRMAGAPTK